MFYKAPLQRANFSRYAGLQFFSEVNIDSREHLTVDLWDLSGTSVFTKTLEPALGWQRR